MKKNFFKIVLCFIIIVLNAVLFSCSKFEPIDYNVSAIQNNETVEDDNFSFNIKNNKLENDKYITKKDRDKRAIERIKVLLSQTDRTPVKAKGVYYPAYVLGDKKQFKDILEHLKNSCINTVVVDVKDDTGHITVKLNSPLVDKYDTYNVRMADFEEMAKQLKENNIYLIARVAAFRDTTLAKKNHNLAVMTKFGYLYVDDSKFSWLNPYKKENWDYLLEIGKCCKAIGFDEVQYDYFRFSTDKGMQSVVFDEEQTNGRSYSDVMIECCQYLYENLIPEGIFVSIDVFGSIISSYRDQESVGQNYVDLLKYSDYVCPMLYPSHYSDGYYGITHPDLEPYNVVKAALNASKSVIQNDDNPSFHYGIVRPWLQAFTADYIENYQVYGEKQYFEQIKAVEDAGYDEWLFWNAAGNYNWDFFTKLKNK